MSAGLDLPPPPTTITIDDSQVPRVTADDLRARLDASIAAVMTP